MTQRKYRKLEIQMQEWNASHLNQHSWNPQTHESPNLLTTSNTTPKIIHCKTNTAVLTDAQAATGPSNDGSRACLADDTRRAIGTETRCARFPGVRFSIVRSLRAAREDELFKDI